MDPQESLPFITICMPVYNSKWCLNYTLKALYNIDYPKNLLRLVFVDNCSTDGTYEMLKEFKQKFKSEYESIIIDRTCKKGLGHVRNVCLKYKKGFVFWAESDVIVPPRILKTLLSHFYRDPRIGWAHAPNVRENPTFIEKIYMSRLPKRYGYAESAEHTSSLIRPEVIEAMGPFYEKGGYPFDSWEAAAHFVRIRKAGWKILIDNTIHCIHLRRNDVKTNFNLRKKNVKSTWNYFKSTLHYYFYRFPKRPVHEFVKEGDIFYTLRLIYYFILPIAVIFALVTHQLLILLYMLPSIMYYLITTRGWIMKLITCFFVISCRIIVSYGYVWLLLKIFFKHFKR